MIHDSSRCERFRLRTVLSMLLLAGTAGRPAPAARGADPADAPPASAASGIAAWAGLPADGPEGLPLPLTASWMETKMFGPERFARMIENGHHLLITFRGMNDHVMIAHLKDDPEWTARMQTRFEKEYRPALEYARQHGLPIAFRGNNWSYDLIRYEDRRAECTDFEITNENTIRLVLDGKRQNVVDPYGPLDGWRERGRFWLGNGLMRMIQECYPNPPMVVFLDNNEGPTVRREPHKIPENYDRLVAEHGEGPYDVDTRRRLNRDAYARRYHAMYDAARESVTQPGWREALVFIGYNAEPDLYTGWMQSMYDNDWQPHKSDYTPSSMQAEAMKYFSMREKMFGKWADFYWSFIVWDGGRVSNVWRGPRATSKTFRYITRGQRWDFDRYGGWVQFCLWMARPRSCREFRYPAYDEHAYDRGTFTALLNAVDRVWAHPTLREFWRFGVTLAPFPGERLPNLLTADANPPRETWQAQTMLPVFAQALRLGEVPERRWLIYAHAPRGGRSGVTVDVPGYGKATLASVPVGGSFFLLEEADASQEQFHVHGTGQGDEAASRWIRLEALLAGGPDEVGLAADPMRPQAGSPVRFEARIEHAPGRAPTGWTWTFGDGAIARQDAAGTVEHAFAEPGEYLVTAAAHFATGPDVMEQVAVYVGGEPVAELLYDLSLRHAFWWSGPWGDSGETDHDLVTYRHLPNGGSLPDPVLVGGRFVDDEERGKVLETDGRTALWLIRDDHTCMKWEGHPSQTIDLWIKAADADGRQVICSQGIKETGFNIYLDGDKLYAGCWASADNMKAKGWYAIPGRAFPGQWLSGSITTGRWHRITYVLREAGDQVADDRQCLYLDGRPVDRGPAVRIPRHYAPPALLRGASPRFHDHGQPDAVTDVRGFRGRLSGFRLLRSAEAPRDDDGILSTR